MGLFSKIKEGLFKTRGNMGAKMDELVENTKEIDDDFYEDLIDIMIMSDVGVKTAEEAVNQLREKCESERKPASAAAAVTPTSPVARRLWAYERRRRRRCSPKGTPMASLKRVLK